MVRSVWLLWFLPALFAVASASDAKLYEGYEHCDLDKFSSSFFHAVTCRGFARVAMNVKDGDTMNRGIDALLVKAKEEHKEKPCLKVKTFYYNATSLLFLKYDLDGGDVAYWITENLGSENEFIPFPTADKWTSLRRKGYSEDKFNKLTQEEKDKSICDAEFSGYNMNRNNVTGEYEYKLENGSCNTKRFNFIRFDPFLSGKYGWRIRHKDNRQQFTNQHFEKLLLVSKRDKQNNYFATFGSVSPSSLDGVRNGSRVINGIKFCFLRKYRTDLNELHEPYMLPKSGDYKLAVQGNETARREPLSTTINQTIPEARTTTAESPVTASKPTATVENQSTASTEVKNTTAAEAITNNTVNASSSVRGSINETESASDDNVRSAHNSPDLAGIERGNATSSAGTYGFLAVGSILILNALSQ
ncbi:hypothetical protein QR680_006508 [Steinernema hermaphroditum]|uniref:Uncharacterized protein n=1 Tax=Steinernema hermaphroditum TaxID=289476 RepID=A0AA39HVP4_9BILA|nr:hypothetical protein QR680_006508 [Steinernema hermaphroditum]